MMHFSNAHDGENSEIYCLANNSILKTGKYGVRSKQDFKTTGPVAIFFVSVVLKSP
jgi:hypothetical protein